MTPVGSCSDGSLSWLSEVRRGWFGMRDYEQQKLACFSQLLPAKRSAASQLACW